ncbi:MAG: hypothetical protein KatS3mg008_1556 [Acidimicrobiales bacterium]|nr:MAG: hypothetical protein KatS3mg008_1556 [Acidimicrobiales bacterium]
MRRRAFLSLGSNVGDRTTHLVKAVRALHAEGVLKAVSEVFETEPVGGPEQGPYLNLVAELSTDRSPWALLELARRLEEAAGRTRDVRWGPRTLDVDVLLVEGECVDSPELQVPHPRMWERRFVLAPLRQLAPDLVTASAVERAVGRVTPIGRLHWRQTPLPSSVRLIGPGRAGLSLADALVRVGWNVEGILGRNDDPRDAALGVDVLVIATPDDQIQAVARRVTPVEDTLVVHLAGSLGPSVLHPHPRRAALHPLVSLPDRRVGARRLLEGIPFALAGDPAAAALAEALGGRVLDVPEERRAVYHAAACIASNHLVALLDQVDTVARRAGLELSDFGRLVEGTIENVEELGTLAALTGPAARGDTGTLQRHRAELPEEEHEAYWALARRAMRMALARRQVAEAGERAQPPVGRPEEPVGKPDERRDA